MLGDSLRVNSIGLGCMGITHAFGTSLSKKEGMKVISEAYDMGYDLPANASSMIRRAWK